MRVMGAVAQSRAAKAAYDREAERHIAMARAEATRLRAAGQEPRPYKCGPWRWTA
jgi:hypothetical protein